MENAPYHHIALYLSGINAILIFADVEQWKKLLVSFGEKKREQTA